MELWAANCDHVDGNGNPWGSCPTCLGRNSVLLPVHSNLRQVQEQAHNYQQWEHELRKEEEIVRDKEDRREEPERPGGRAKSPSSFQQESEVAIIGERPD